MKIDRKEVEHVARLARLELGEEEIEKFTHQLSATLEYMDKLNELDTTGIEPTSHILEFTNVFKEDQVKVGPWGHVTLSNAPAQEQSHYKVPKIIE
ncbi:MAG: asparaginyl/glutamyl-tRNA amidotransferase subunit C [Nitrospinae bacterium RIFCSPLOWO2_12_FULL_45_22]|nr:MAG: asparaginyl/glutamyl-tRNA amidotransferase subunit C [Nitrospinae bacterium RIFCSPLOWO2_12_FULL_45_22]